MKCHQISTALSRFQDGELSPGEMRLVRSHLNDCTECQREWRHLEQVLDSLNGIKDVKPAPNFTALTMARIKEQKNHSGILLPSLVYSFVFLLFFTLGIIMVQPFSSQKTIDRKDLTMVQILMEGQELNQFKIQSKTLSWFYNGGFNE